MNEDELTAEEVRRCLGERVDRRGHRIFSAEATALAVRFATAKITKGFSARRVSEELGLKGIGEAFDRGTYGPGIEPRNQAIQSADAVIRGGRPHAPHRNREARCDSARSKTPSTHGTSLRENREISGLPTAMGWWDASERQ